MTDQEIYDIVSVHVNSEQEVTRKLAAVPLVRRLVRDAIISGILLLARLKLEAEKDRMEDAYIKGLRDSIKALNKYKEQWK